MSTTTITTPTFRIAVEEDAEDLEQLVHLAYRSRTASVSWKNEGHLVQGPRITAAEVKELISTDNSTIMLSELTLDGKPKTVGCVHIEKHGHEALIGLIAVNPEVQNIGLGRKLVNIAEQHAREFYECTIAKMTVLSQRDELMKWYESLGYTQTGETKPFFGPDSNQVALIDNPYFRVITKKL